MALTKTEWIALGISTGVALVLFAIGFFVNGTTGAILCGSIGILLILGCLFLQEKSKEDFVLYILAALVFMPVLYYSVTGHPVFSAPKSKPDLTSDKVLESQVGEWLSQANYGPSNPKPTGLDNVKFLFSAGPPQTSYPVLILKRSYKTTSLELWTEIRMTDPKLKSLSSLNRDKLIHALRTQTLQLNFDYDSTDTLLKSVTWQVKKNVRIRDGMEEDLLETIEQLGRATLMIEQTIKDELAKH